MSCSMDFLASLKVVSAVSNKPITVGLIFDFGLSSVALADFSKSMKSPSSAAAFFFAIRSRPEIWKSNRRAGDQNRACDQNQGGLGCYFFFRGAFCVMAKQTLMA